MELAMVLLKDGSSEHGAQVWGKKGHLEKIGFDDSVDVNKCLQQIERPALLHRTEFWATIKYKYHGSPQIRFNDNAGVFP